MEKEDNLWKCSIFKPSQWKKLLLCFVVINICIWIFYYKSPNLSYFNYQTKTVEVKHVSAPIYNVSIFHIPLLEAKDMTPFYTEVRKKTWCFIYGIDPVESKKRSKCICLDLWFGLDCGIPSAIWKSSFMQEGKNANIEIRRRERPRRIISSIVIGGYQDILDISILNTFSVVDLFLTVEGSNQKPSMINLLKNGYLAEWQSKIIPFQLKKNITNRLDPEQTLLAFKELWEIAWKRLTDYRPDDLLIFSHTSSIISKDVLLFLKLYDGYPEPFFFELRPLLFKFWRQIASNNTNAKLVPFQPTGCTFQYMSSMCSFDITPLFTNNCHEMEIKSFSKNHWPVKVWFIGNKYAPSGWQCNLCCENKCVEEYLTGSKKISLFIDTGENRTHIAKQVLETINIFDNKDIILETISNSDPYFAPNAVLNKEKKYSYLIDNTDNFKII